MLECAGDVCLYTLVVCSEWLFVVAFSTRCNCCDSYFVSFNSTPTLPAVRDLGTVDRKLQERIQQHVLAPLAKAEAEDQLFDDRAMETLGYAPEEIDLVRAKWTELRAPGAQDWLKALPVHPDLELPNELLRTTLAHHLLVLRKTFLRVVGVPELSR